eukprot:gene38122-47047_t
MSAAVAFRPDQPIYSHSKEIVMTQVAPIPEGFQTVTPHLVCEGAADAIEFYKKAFNAQEMCRMPGPGGKVMHAQIKIGSSFFYAHTSQWRHEKLHTDEIASPLAGDDVAPMTLLDYNAKAERLGWLPSAPQLQTNPLEVTRAAAAAGMAPGEYAVQADAGFVEHEQGVDQAGAQG